MNCEYVKIMVRLKKWISQYFDYSLQSRVRFSLTQEKSGVFYEVMTLVPLLLERKREPED